MKYGIQFLVDTQKKGIEYATKNLVKTTITEHIIPAVTDYAWENIENNLVQSGSNKSLVAFSEEAFKETLNEIMIEGVKAL